MLVVLLPSGGGFVFFLAHLRMAPILEEMGLSPPAISVSVIACDEEANISRCLASTRELAAAHELEIILVDSGSKDRTVEISESFGAKVSHNDWPGHRDQKNVALDRCSHDWVLALDCDEELTPDLTASILAFFQNGHHDQYEGASMNRRVWFLGRWITHGDWYPDRKVRLFRKSCACWTGSHEHDKIKLDGACLQLHGDLNHFSFPDTRRYIEKINHYADAYLKRELEAGNAWCLGQNLLRPIWRFLRAYFLRRGFLDGFPGLWIATATAFQTFVRHSRTYEEAQPSQPPKQP